jgi:phosphonate transport system substrate-binding protein
MSTIRKTLLATAALVALGYPGVHAEDLNVLRIGILGGENEADRLA